MAEIRETELNRPGGYRAAEITFSSGSGSESVTTLDVFVDRFGRLIVPNSDLWTIAKSIRFHGETEVNHICRKEPRYEGQKITSLVLYLHETKEPNPNA